MKRFFLLFLFCIGTVGYAMSSPVEGISHFYAIAQVKEDSSLAVTETLVVQSAGESIQRGIFRTIPVKGYESFQFVSVTHDGKAEPYFVKKSGSNKIVYIGDKDKLLPPGTYIYKISYVVKNALRFHKDFDELYWNVTGNAWPWTIEHASFRLELPPGADIVPNGISWYTGAVGANGMDVSMPQDLFFVTDMPLKPKEGLTVSVAWKKGVVKEPSFFKKMIDSENFYIIIAFLVIWLIFLFYYIVAWFVVGKDPKSRVLRCFSPPEGMSPAQVRYMRQMKNDSQMLSAVLISLVQKGFVKVEKEEAGTFVLTRAEADKLLLSAEEKAGLDALFEEGDSLLVNSRFGSFFRAAFSAISHSLNEWAGKRYFSVNTGYKAPTILLAIIFVVFCLEWGLFNKNFSEYIFILIYCIIFVSLLQQVLANFYPRLKNFPFGWTTFLAILFWVLGWKWGLLALVVFLPGIVFDCVIPAYTRLGREKMDEIEGFLEYLTVAETNRVFASNPTDAARIYCDYLPYAVAMDVQNKWWRALADALGEAAAERAVSVQMEVLISADFCTELISSVNSAAFPPPSSSDDSGSGFGGGGCSGGGSGGGGGGGW